MVAATLDPSPVTPGPGGLRTALYQLRMLLDAELNRVTRSTELVSRLDGGALFALSAERANAVETLTSITGQVQAAVASARQVGQPVDESTLQHVRNLAARLMDANRTLAARLGNALRILDSHQGATRTRSTYQRHGHRGGDSATVFRARTA